MIQSVFSSMITILLARFMLNDVPHAAGLIGNPGNPRSFGGETERIMVKAGLGEYIPPPFGVFTERDESTIRRKRKPPASVRTRDVWIYRIVMERRDGRCRIKLYEYVSGRGDKLRAVWSGEGPYCDVKFEEITKAIRQVEFEYKQRMKGSLTE